MELANPESHFRPSRTCYPGSKSGPKSRYDLPTRHKSYGNGSVADAILFDGTSLQPHSWNPSATYPPDPHPMNDSKAPRSNMVLTDAARAILHPLSERNLPELPLVDKSDGVQGISVLGGKGSGKTSLVLSLQAFLTGEYASRHDKAAHDKRSIMPTYGHQYELPEYCVKLPGGGTENMKLVLTDTPPCGTDSREEHPLVADVHPNSTRHFNAIPSWMRISLRGNIPHQAVIFVVDAAAAPLWQDEDRCRGIARLFSVLKRSQFIVVIAVTKLLAARTEALKNEKKGKPHGGEVGIDPCQCYETFVGRYLEKCASSIQASANKAGFRLRYGDTAEDAKPFPLINHTIFDVPTWTSVGEFRSWSNKTGTAELPNLQYAKKQLGRLLSAAAMRAPLE